MIKHISTLLHKIFGKQDKKGTVVSDNSVSIMGQVCLPISLLVKDYPPTFFDKYKQRRWNETKLFHNEKLTNNSLGDINVLRVCWGASKVIDIDLSFKTEITFVPYFFDYRQSTKDKTTWYINFADPQLFVAYRGSLFAQDEIQTLEHPLLPSVLEYLDANHLPGLVARTVEGIRPTPYIFMNVPNLININTSPVLPDGSTVSIYGNRFSFYENSNPEILDQAITIRKDINKSNLIAMSAPTPGYGSYDKETIIYMIETVLASFISAKRYSEGTMVEIHTGRWGAGAFGGSEELALTVQIIGAIVARVDNLVFHAVTESSLTKAKTTISSIIESLGNKPTSLDSIVSYLFSQEYKWGVSDGN